VSLSSRIAVTSSFSRNPVLRNELQVRYPHVTFNDEDVSLSNLALVSFLDGHDKAITALERLDDAVFEALPELRVISKYGVGLDMIDLRAMQARGVKLGWTPGVNCRSLPDRVTVNGPAAWQAYT
jgi:lactate dehydrogenase-like 2-hydroxyacid dehydrogenase